MRRCSSDSLGRLCVALVLLTVAVAGCGSSEYSRLVSKRLGQLRGETKFRSLFASSKLSGTPIQIRVPMLFRDSYVEDSSHSQDGAKIDPDRVQPPFLKLPGFKICYEGTMADAQQRRGTPTSWPRNCKPSSKRLSRTLPTNGK
jgi:hypothetical protein